MSEPDLDRPARWNSYDLEFPAPSSSIKMPKETWQWDFLGGGQLVIRITDNVPSPTAWQRFWTRVLFGSKWTDLRSRE